MRKLMSLLACLLSANTTVSAFAETTTATQTKTFLLNTNAFTQHSKIPVIYTCDGKDVSPALSWQNVPAKTETLALILSDPDAPNGTFYHWVVFNIPATSKGFAEDIKQLPEGAITGKNSWGKQQYNGPCPPKGFEHRYIFTLYALDSTLTLTANADAQKVLSAIENHIIGKTTFTGLFIH